MPERVPWDHEALVQAIARGGCWSGIAENYNRRTGQRRSMKTVYQRAMRKRLRPPYDPKKPGRPRQT